MKRYSCIMLAIGTMAICLLTSGNMGCNPPAQPPDDTLLDPPDPPTLARPLDDEDFFMPDWNKPDTIIFVWSAVKDAEFYQIQLSFDSLFSSGSIYTVDTVTYIFSFAIGGDHFRLYWHVRAGNDKWKYMTAWSERRRFQVIYPPGDKTNDNAPGYIVSTKSRQISCTIQ